MSLTMFFYECINILLETEMQNVVQWILHHFETIDDKSKMMEVLLQRAINEENINALAVLMKNSEDTMDEQGMLPL